MVGWGGGCKESSTDPVGMFQSLGDATGDGQRGVELQHEDVLQGRPGNTQYIMRPQAPHSRSLGFLHTFKSPHFT